MRTRYTSTNGLYICVPPAKLCDKPSTFEAIKDMFLHKRALLTEFERQIMRDADERTYFHPKDDWFVNLVCWNTLERNIQEVNPLTQVVTLIEQLKWDVNFQISEDLSTDKNTPILDSRLANWIPSVKDAQIKA